MTGEPQVGRILTDAERQARMGDEAAYSVEPEVLRTAFAISGRYILTACHCVRDDDTGQQALWFRLRNPQPGSGRSYIYLPVRLANYDDNFDAAALAIDERRLAEAHFTAAQATVLLRQVAIPLSFEVREGDAVQVMGFPASASGADSDTNSAEVVDTDLPLGDVAGLKLFSGSFGAISPVDPHGLSGGPVLRLTQLDGERLHVAVGLVRSFPGGTVPDAASGGCVIATRIEDIVDRLPEVAAAMHATRESAGLLPGTRPAHRLSTLSASSACWRRLRDSVVVAHDPEHGELVGWTHFFNEPAAHRRPTAIGTAYGLKLALLLGSHDYHPDRSALAETLWKLRRPDGGWSARTGTDAGRPEVSALVLGALAASGYDAVRVSEAATALESALVPGADPVAQERTYIVTAVMRGLIRARPTSPLLAQLRATLVAGAVTDSAHDNLLCWAGRLDAGDGEELHPSVPHTAQALVALLRANQVLREDAKTRGAVDQAVRWLRAHRGLANQTEQIRRYIADDRPWETLTVRHFTAAWVARALLLLPPTQHDDADVLLGAAIRQVWEAHHNGLWVWDDGDQPLWMSYQGAAVVRDYAMHMSTVVR